MTNFFITILNWIFGWVNNYGWSVIIFTLFIKLVLLPLDVKSRKSMRAMSMLNPQLEALKKRYANDQDKLNRKTQELYRSNHVNPLSGCLPILIQMPILYIMFRAMRNVAAQKQVEMLYSWAQSSGLASVTAEGAYTGLNWQALANVSRDIGSFNVDFGNTQSWLWIKSVFQADNMNRFVIPSVSELTTSFNSYKSYFETALTADQFKFLQDYISGSGLNAANKLEILKSVLSAYGLSDGSELFEAIKAFMDGSSSVSFEALYESVQLTVTDANALEVIKYCLYPAGGYDSSAVIAYLNESAVSMDMSLRQLLAYLVSSGQNSVVYGNVIDSALSATTQGYSASILGIFTIAFPTKFNRYINGYFILPILACATQILATKLQPATAAPEAQSAAKDGQAQNPTASTGKFMKWLFPIMSLWICWTSTAAFAIYWVFVNVWSIVSSYAINLFLTMKEKKNDSNPKPLDGGNSKNKKEALQP